MHDELMRVALLVIDALETLDVPYLIGGSLASAVHGVARSTLDVIADLRPEHIDPLASALAGVFYVDVETIREAAYGRRGFNVMDLETMSKVDVFVARERPYDREQLRRGTTRPVTTGPERHASFASAEGRILAKLEWYRLGGEVSERQWRDVLGILDAQPGRLDVGYLGRWAMALGVRGSPGGNRGPGGTAGTLRSRRGYSWARMRWAVERLAALG